MQSPNISTRQFSNTIQPWKGSKMQLWRREDMKIMGNLRFLRMLVKKYGDTTVKAICEMREFDLKTVNAKVRV